MRIGTVCYATEQGLGYLAKAFYDNGVVTDPVVLRHHSRPTRTEWYPPGTPVVPNAGGLWRGDALRTLEACDVVLFFETPFSWPLIQHLRGEGVRTALMPMYECSPEVLPAVPDLFINPSALDQRYYPNGVHIPVPAPSFQEVPWKARGKVETFVHNAGHGGLLGRNGTAEVLAAVKYVKSAARFLIRTQGPANELMNRVDSALNVDFVYDTVPREELYADGEAFLFPEKFNGLSLPLQEAYAAGMLVMATDRFPNNAYLPTAPLVPTLGSRRNRVSPRCNEFDEAVLNPREIARVVDHWYGRDVGEFSGMGRAWREENSWERLKLKYLEVLAG